MSPRPSCHLCHGTGRIPVHCGDEYPDTRYRDCYCDPDGTVDDPFTPAPEPSAWAAMRDASGWNTPRQDRGARFHVATTDGLAVCSGEALDENGRVDLADVPEVLRCQRSACLARWPR